MMCSGSLDNKHEASKNIEADAQEASLACRKEVAEKLTVSPETRNRSHGGDALAAAGDGDDKCW